jgi:hypothetical protein
VENAAQDEGRGGARRRSRVNPPHSVKSMNEWETGVQARRRSQVSSEYGEYRDGMNGNGHRDRVLSVLA